MPSVRKLPLTRLTGADEGGGGAAPNWRPHVGQKRTSPGRFVPQRSQNICHLRLAIKVYGPRVKFVPALSGACLCLRRRGANKGWKCVVHPGRWVTALYYCAFVCSQSQRAATVRDREGAIS